MNLANIWKTWKGHAGFGCLAFDSLPAWQRRLFKLDLSPSALDKPYLPAGGILTAREKAGYFCRIMDLVYYDDCRPYATLPDGRWIPHGPPDDLGQASATSGGSMSPLVSAGIIEMLMNRMIRAVQSNDWEEAIRHGGALGHYVQEPFTPAHAVNNDEIQKLFPDPVAGRHVRLHHFFDCGSISFEPARPVLMGTTVAEAAFRIQVEIDRGIILAKSLVGPVVRLVYTCKSAIQLKSEKILAGQSRSATWLTACAWYTAICIARRRFRRQEVEKLAKISLADMTPYFWHHCQYCDLLPGALVKDKVKIPMHVCGSHRGRAARDELVREGFGMGGHMGCKFFVNGNIYRRFACRVGLPSRQREGQTDKTYVEFRLEVDRKLNRVYSEELKYGGRVLARVTLRPGIPPIKTVVDISGARTLMLICESKPGRDPSGHIKWEVPHVAVCEPVLFKT
mgnify:CR=1 FL=1